MGSKTGLEAIEKTVIDRAVQKIYQLLRRTPAGEYAILGDLMEACWRRASRRPTGWPGAGSVCERFAELL